MSGLELCSGKCEEDNFFLANLTTSNLTCLAESIRDPIELPYSAIFTTAVTVLRVIFWLLLFPCGLTLNTLVIVLFAKFRKLQVPSFFVALQIVAVDLVLSVVITLIPLANLLAKKWVFGPYVCVIVGVIIDTTSHIRTVLLFVVTLDRFLSVFLPFFYPKHEVKIVASLSLASWVISVFPVIISVSFDCYTFGSINWLCFTNNHCSGRCLSLVLSSVVLLLPFILIPIFLYVLLYIKARRLAKSIAAAPSTSRRAAFTFFLLFLSVILVTIPLLVVSITTEVLYEGDMPPLMYLLNVIVLMLTSLLVVTDPIIIMWNRDVREILSKVKVKMVSRWCSHLLPSASSERGESKTNSSQV